MACRGVHFAITEEQADRLLRASNQRFHGVSDEDSDDAVLEIIEEIEEAWDDEHTQETDKAWDAIHRCLTNGTLDSDTGSYPLNLCIFGGENLCYSGDYFVVYVVSKAVKDVAAAMVNVSQEWLKERYWNLPPDYPDKSQDDWEYTWEYFQYLSQFFQKAALAERPVIFTVDQ